MTNSDWNLWIGRPPSGNLGILASDRTLAGAVLMTLLQHAPDAVVTLDQEGRLHEFNPAAERLFGYGREEVVGRDLAEMLIPPRLHSIQREALLRCLALNSETPQQWQLPVLRADGNELIVDVTLCPVLGEAPQLFVAFFRDRTGRLRTDPSVRDRESRFRHLAEQNDDAVLLYDLNGRFLEVNHQACARLQYTREELLSLRITDIEDQLSLESLPCHDLTNRPQPLASTHRRKDGSTFPVEVLLHLFEEGGRTLILALARDVTERKRIETSAESQLSSHRLLLERSPVGMVISHLDGRIEETNDALARMLGCAGAADLLACNLWDFCLDANAQPQLIQALNTRGALTSYPVDLRRKDGSRLSTLANLNLLPRSEGELLLHAIFLDDTARQTAERARQVSEDRFRQLVDKTIEGVWLLDEQQRTVFANPPMAEMLHLPATGLDGTSFWDFVHPEDQRLASFLLKEKTATTSEHHEFRFRRYDGTDLWCLMSTNPLQDEDGHSSGTMVLITDVTERKKLQLERDRLLEKLQLQIDRMPLGYLLTGPDFCYTHWNPAAETIFGFSEREVLGRHAFDLIVPEVSRPILEATFQRLTQGDMSAHVTCANLTRTGRQILCQWHNTPLYQPDGTFAGLLSLVQDITEQHSLEEQLRQSQKMESIGRLAGGVAHDFNNLLTVINGYSDVITSLLHEQHGARPLVAEVKKAGLRAAGLTRQLLAFSRKQILAPKILDLNTIIRDAANLMQRLLGNGVQLRFVLQDDLWAIKADPAQLEQVLFNLAVHSRDTMPEGGSLRIETQNLSSPTELGELSLPLDWKQGEGVLLTMTDTGTGMDEETRLRIFEPFYAPLSDKGTGLGLATVYGTVTQSGGQIRVTSELGQGTQFRIFLPRAPEKRIPNRASLQGIVGMPPGTETILLAEDEDGVRSLGRHILESCGYAVLEAVDGLEAVQIASSHSEHLDLLLTDVVMPRMGGAEAAEQIRRLHPETKVLFLSGYTDDAAVRHGISEELVHFLPKPFSPAALARKIREVLDDHRPQ